MTKESIDATIESYSDHDFRIDKNGDLEEYNLISDAQDNNKHKISPLMKTFTAGLTALNGVLSIGNYVTALTYKFQALNETNPEFKKELFDTATNYFIGGHFTTGLTFLTAGLLLYEHNKNQSLKDKLDYNNHKQDIQNI